jgi:hypothetical protein
VLFITKVNPDCYNVYLADEETFQSELGLKKLLVELFIAMSQRIYVK